jgi:hypothetical protein
MAGPPNQNLRVSWRSLFVSTPSNHCISWTTVAVHMYVGVTWKKHGHPYIRTSLAFHRPYSCLDFLIITSLGRREWVWSTAYTSFVLRVYCVRTSGDNNMETALLSARCFLSVSLGVESIVRLPFCLPFPEFVCCLRVAFTCHCVFSWVCVLFARGHNWSFEEIKYLVFEGETAGDNRRLLPAGRILLYLFLQNTVNLQRSHLSPVSSDC